MVRELSARHALPRDIVEGVSERTGGVPLFVEEVTRLLLERGEQGGAQAIPPTLQQSLAARLDRLGSARETAQIGAVLGRGFSYALLQSVAGLDEGALQSALERLAEADILFVEGDGAQATYRFKHALIQDAAYDSLLKSRRQALHAQAAEILRESAIARTRGDRPSFHPSRPRRSGDRMVGQGRRPGAAPLRLPGGDRPSRQGDQDGGHGGRTAAAADAGQLRREQLTQLHVAYGNALMAARGYSAPETSGSLCPSPRVRVWRQGRAGTVGRRLRLMGRQLHAGRAPVDAGARGGLPQRRRGEARFARGRRRPPRRRDDVLVRRRVSRGARVIWKGRSPCSNPVATTIWPFASDRTPASPRWPTWRLRLASRRSRSRDFAHRPYARRGSQASRHVGTLAVRRMHAAMFELMRATTCAPRRTRSSSFVSRASTICQPVARVRSVSRRAWATAAERRASRRARGHASRRSTAARTERSVVRRAH